MKITTKTLTSLLIITVLTLSTTSIVAATNTDTRTTDHRLEKVTKRHDRKMELRASVLGVSPTELRDELKNKSFENIIKKHGFKTKEAFRLAVAGKLKDELKKRGWSDRKIHKLLHKKMHKLRHHH